MKKVISLIVILVFLILTFGCTQYHAQGAGAGGAIGGIAGALLDHRNPWRGGVIGGLLGALAGATFTDISMRASYEAAYSGRPVEYRTRDGRAFYRAEPGPIDESTRCRKVHERAWEDGNLVKDQVKEICESERYERRY